MKKNALFSGLPHAFAELISKKGILIFIFSIFSVVTDQLLTRLMENELLNSSGTSSIIWVYGTASFLLGFVGPLIIALLVISAWRKSSERTLSIISNSFAQLAKEGLRVLGKTLAWGFLFIIPGVVRFFSYLFVPYIVLLDSRYAKGEIDALRTSSRQVRRSWFRLLIVFILFSLAWPLMMTIFDPYRSFIDSPATALPFFFVELTVSLVFQWLVLRIWESSYESNI